MESADGIVLLDEIGAHLHPRWKMRMVKSLRECFPRLQFVVSTHDPLCLRGLHDGEILLLRRTPRGKVYAVEDLPSIQGLRVDQLLTSEYFGLSSTLDPDVEAAFEEYYHLKALRELTTRQRNRLKQLEQTVNEIDAPGTTKRERMFLSVIDSYLARDRYASSQSDRARLLREADTAISEALTKQ